MNREDLSILNSLLEGTERNVSRLANAAAFLYDCLDRVCWVGFYLSDEKGDLYLGPFIGKPACTIIRKGRGVCGTSAVEKRTVIVPDVTKFPGYISCDAAAKSEVVVPIFEGNEVLAVLDIDSGETGRFTEDGPAGDEIRLLEEAVKGIIPTGGRLQTLSRV